jgi:hypothetical protein
MPEFSAEKVWSLNEKEFLSLLESGVLASRIRQVKFYTPSFAYHKAIHDCSSNVRFPTISVTGK